MNNDLWVLIPAFNEERTIKNVVNRSKKFVSNVLVVNDGSTDKTKQKLKELRHERVLHHDKNHGKGGALRTGFHHIKKKGFKRIVTLDADMQHLPEEIPLLLKEDADIVIGARLINRRTMPFARRLSNRLVNKLFEIKTSFKLNDVQSGFRAYNKKAIQSLDFEDKGFITDFLVLKQAVKKGLRIKEVPITCVYGSEKSKIKPLRDSIKFIKEIIIN